MSMRVGIDLVSVESVRDSVNMHGEHYLRRIYTERELQDCSTPTGVNPERLAARFAAKEATLKVLRPDEQGIPWNAIEVRRHPSGWVDLELSGPAAALAAEAGVTELALSIAHEKGFATAIVTAICSQETNAGTR
ncbi:MAG: holo-ACP synthase [Solirubrobacteraceae bacterium]